MIKKKRTDFRTGGKKRKGGWEESQKKAAGPKRKKIYLLASGSVVGLVVGAVVFLIYTWLSSSDFFRITSIKIEGENRLDKQQVIELSGITIRTNILDLDVDSVTKKIESHDWIQSAVLKKKLPGDLTITIQEREPVALVNKEDGLFYVDKRGRVFASANPPDELDYPIITGLENYPEVIADKVLEGPSPMGEALEKALLFINYAGKGSSSLPRQNISEMHLTENGEFILYLADRPFPIFVGTEVSTKRYYQLAKVLYWLYKKREFSDVNFIRMDYMDNKVLVGKKDDVES